MLRLWAFGRLLVPLCQAASSLHRCQLTVATFVAWPRETSSPSKRNERECHDAPAPVRRRLDDYEWINICGYEY
jgi:hypothetical protein